MIAVTTETRLEGYEIAAYKGTAQGATFDDLLRHAEALGANAILNTCYDDALDVETLFHGAAVVIEPVASRRTAQVRAALAVNRELVLLYWSMGRDILSRQKQHGWGAKIIDRLAADLHKAFPEITGLSPRNLKYMRAFAEAWPR